MLQNQNIQENHLFFGLTDSSWNDDQDTGCYIITYMGGVVDHEGCVAFMAASHLRMLLCELEGTADESMSPTNIYFDSKSAIVIGANYKDTKHTRHIMRRYHYM